MVAPTRLPEAPAVVDGIISVRGELVPVLNVRLRFGLPPTPPSPADHLILAKSDRLVALRVDRVADILSIDMAAVEELALMVPGALYVSSIAKLPDGLILIHDLPTFLSNEELLQLTSAMRNLRLENQS